MERWRNGRRAALRWQCREAWEFESPPLHFQCGNSSVGRAQPCQGWGREFEPRFPLMLAQVAELVDAHVSGACVERRAGSTPVLGTKAKGPIFFLECRTFLFMWFSVCVRRLAVD